MSTPLRLALADDQALVRAGLKALLESFGDVSVVIEAVDGAELLAALDAVDVDVVLSDVRMAGMSGPEAVRQLRAAGAATPR